MVQVAEMVQVDGLRHGLHHSITFHGLPLGSDVIHDPGLDLRVHEDSDAADSDGLRELAARHHLLKQRPADADAAASLVGPDECSHGGTCAGGGT